MKCGAKPRKRARTPCKAHSRQWIAHDKKFMRKSHAANGKLLSGKIFFFAFLHPNYKNAALFTDTRQASLCASRWQCFGTKFCDCFVGSCDGRIEVPVRINECIWSFICFHKKVQRTMQLTKFWLELWGHWERVTITFWSSVPDSCASCWNFSSMLPVAAFDGDWDTRQPR